MAGTASSNGSSTSATSPATSSTSCRGWRNTDDALGEPWQGDGRLYRADRSLGIDDLRADRDGHDELAHLVRPAAQEAQGRQESQGRQKAEIATAPAPLRWTRSPAPR